MNTGAMLAVQLRMQRLLAALSLAAALAACAPMEWTRSDATPEQIAADMRACRDQAWRETSWSSLSYGYWGPAMLSDPFFGRRYLWPYYSPFGDPFGDRFLEESRLTNFCMRAKGYDLAPLTK
jgi:hypothetical protein